MFPRPYKVLPGHPLHPYNLISHHSLPVSQSPSAVSLRGSVSEVWHREFFYLKIHSFLNGFQGSFSPQGLQEINPFPSMACILIWRGKWLLVCLFIILWIISVCARVHVHMCVCVCVYAGVLVWVLRSEVDLRCLLYCFHLIFWDKVSHWLNHAGQQVPGIALSLPFQCQGYKHPPPCLLSNVCTRATKSACSGASCMVSKSSTTEMHPRTPIP